MSKSNEDINVLEMSDDDFIKDIPEYTPTEKVSGDDDGNDDDDSDDEKGTIVAAVDNDASSVKDDKEVHDGVADAEKAASEKDDADKDAQKAPVTETEKQAADVLTEEQYAAVGRQIMAEFKANGTTMKVKSVDDALQLMQMGANYHKKMVGLKPSLKTLKLLENHDLLDPEKLNYLIDLSQKKPEAIKKLLKDSDIDPLSIDMEEQDNYVPQQRTVNDKELLLDEVLNNISSSPYYDRTLDVIGNKWDEPSRRAVADDPELIAVINSHMENGIFDQVANAVAYERSLGKLVGVSELVAYQRIGAHMHENNLFKRATGEPTQVPQSDKVPASQDTSKQQEEQERRDRKKAASPSRQTPGTGKADSNYNPLAMSDEDFAKLNKLNL